MFGFGIQPWFEYFSVCKGRVLIPLQSRIGPEQGFPCVLFPRRENPGFITGFPGDENRFFPVRNAKQGKPCFHYRDGFAVHKKFNSMNLLKNVCVISDLYGYGGC